MFTIFENNVNSSRFQHCADYFSENYFDEGFIQPLIFIQPIISEYQILIICLPKCNLWY